MSHRPCTAGGRGDSRHLGEQRLARVPCRILQHAFQQGLENLSKDRPGRDAQLTKLVGPKSIVKTAHDLGIRSELDPYFSIGLGAVAVNPLDMTRAYATFANRGLRIDGSLTGDRPRVVERVEFARTGRVSENRPVARATMTTNEADLLTSILQRVVTQGTGKRAALADRAAAGKTGTTDNYGDAWFVGYTPQLAVAVWVGYPPSSSRC